MRRVGVGLLPRLFMVVLLPICIAMAPQAAAQGQNIVDLMGWIVELAKVGKYAEAIPLARKAAAEAEKQLGKEHPATVTVLFALGDLRSLQGQLDEATS